MPCPTMNMTARGAHPPMGARPPMPAGGFDFTRDGPGGRGPGDHPPLVNVTGEPFMLLTISPPHCRDVLHCPLLMTARMHLPV